jgi:hypothetical protein
METEFVNYTEALALKELGFDEPCFGFYLTNNKINLFNDCKWEERINSDFIHHFMDRDTSCVAPTFFQAFRWFREKYDLCAYVVTAPNYIKGESKYKTRFSYEIYGMNEKSSSTVFITIRDVVNLSTHEEVELECLKKLIEIVKEK